VRKVKDIELPKRPGNAYTQFVSLKFKETANASPGTNVIKSLADSWKSLPFDEKKLFYQMASENSTNYKNKMNEITNKMSEIELKDFKENLKKNKEERIKVLQRFRERKNARLTNKPKRPTLLTIFAKTFDRGEASAQEFIKGVAEKWKMLPEDEKNKFKEQYKREFAVYEKEMAAWDAKMVSEGKPKFASKKFINQLNKKDKPSIKAVKTQSVKAKSKVNRKVLKNKVTKKETKPAKSSEPKTNNGKENAQV